MQALETLWKFARQRIAGSEANEAAALQSHLKVCLLIEMEYPNENECLVVGRLSFIGCRESVSPFVCY